MSDQVLAEAVFTGLVVLLVIALLLHLAIAAYRERRGKGPSADSAGRPPTD